MTWDVEHEADQDESMAAGTTLRLHCRSSNWSPPAADSVVDIVDEAGGHGQATVLVLYRDSDSTFALDLHIHDAASESLDWDDGICAGGVPIRGAEWEEVEREGWFGRALLLDGRY